MHEIEQLLLTKTNNINLVRRYIRFVNTFKSDSGDKHHILPKSNDMFPEYKNLSENSWNCALLDKRSHFIAHWILAKIFPNSSQSLAFYHMSNYNRKRNSRLYAECYENHIENIRIANARPERNAKLSASLTGRIVKEETKQKLRKPRDRDIVEKMLETKRSRTYIVSEERREKQRIAMTGKKKLPHTETAKANISKSKLGKKLFNNGVEQKYHTESPGVGWVEGSLPDVKPSSFGKKWFNDGQTSKMFLEGDQPTGWVPGRCFAKRNRKPRSNWLT